MQLHRSQRSVINRIRRLEAEDHGAAIAIYREAVLSCSASLYSSEQRSAWAAQAEQLAPVLQRGRGLVSCTQAGQVEAFVVRDPPDRISLLYCRPASQRQGRARELLRGAEAEVSHAIFSGALQCRNDRLRTEASFLSRDLFLSEGWQVSWQEELLIRGRLFRRFHLQKTLRSAPSP